MQARIVQVLARYLGYGLAAIATKTGVDLGPSDSIVLPIATGLAALVCAIADHVLHRIQQKASASLS